MDGVHLRDELRRTRERAQGLALANRQRLTTSLRDKTLPKEDRQEMEYLWVAFSASLELLHADMCKVFDMGQSFSLSNKANAFVQTGIQGKTTEVAARALSLPDLNHDETPPSVERLEQSDLEVEIARVDQMIEDMELKVNVLRWMVEAPGTPVRRPRQHRQCLAGSSPHGRRGAGPLLRQKPNICVHDAVRGSHPGCCVICLRGLLSMSLRWKPHGLTFICWRSRKSKSTHSSF
ncbi:hypothetical protein SKAU_G00057380 [Synaphobranchus kaupii]|uniref:Regulator of G-protein signaling 9-binding protein n=1 Tax=Synaphobranchus kaupii TaxID=118154 RepID=A0A9Q1G442_SYNKA|nr:hypothetical protein SKAU_G00057380 [Synaphobranchus kaupii]